MNEAAALDLLASLQAFEEDIRSQRWAGPYPQLMRQIRHSALAPAAKDHLALIVKKLFRTSGQFMAVAKSLAGNIGRHASMLLQRMGGLFELARLTGRLLFSMLGGYACQTLMKAMGLFGNLLLPAIAIARTIITAITAIVPALWNAAAGFVRNVVSWFRGLFGG